MLKNKDESIDLGGIAKGYIIDKIKNIIISNGFCNAIINLGGTVSSIGEKRNIGIRNPFTPINSGNKVDKVIELESINDDVITSGIYEQFISKDGKIYHHILNPNTGYPTDNEIISVTLIGQNGAELDSFATACFSLGLDKSSQLLRNRKIDGIFILNDGRFFYTDGLKDKIKI
jgi:thiamine biosynthesis lipoprotein